MDWSFIQNYLVLICTILVSEVFYTYSEYLSGGCALYTIIITNMICTVKTSKLNTNKLKIFNCHPCIQIITISGLPACLL